MASFPNCRSRPLGISEYSPLTRTAASTAIGRDGMAKPCHGPRISTPSGRGRRISSAAPLAMTSTVSIAPNHTNRWRQRRQMTSTSRFPYQSACSAYAVPSTPAAFITVVSGSERSEVNHSSTRLSSTSTATAVRRVTATTIQKTTTAAASPSHHLPEVWSSRGRGGGSPDGLRRGRARVTAGGGPATTPVGPDAGDPATTAVPSSRGDGRGDLPSSTAAPDGNGQYAESEHRGREPNQRTQDRNQGDRPQDPPAGQERKDPGGGRTHERPADNPGRGGIPERIDQAERGEQGEPERKSDDRHQREDGQDRQTEEQQHAPADRRADRPGARLSDPSAAAPGQPQQQQPNQERGHRKGKPPEQPADPTEPIPVEVGLDPPGLANDRRTGLGHGAVLRHDVAGDRGPAAQRHAPLEHDDVPVDPARDGYWRVEGRQRTVHRAGHGRRTVEHHQITDLGPGGHVCPAGQHHERLGVTARGPVVLRPRGRGQTEHQDDR